MGKKSRDKRERRAYRLDDETAGLLERQKQLFKEKFGRDAGPGEPLFFDPDHPTPRPLQLEPTEAMVSQTMRRAGIRPELIYAFEKTGRLVARSNLHQLTKGEIAEWEAAIAEYFAKHSGGENGINPREPLRGGD